MAEDDVPNPPTMLARRWMITISAVLGSTLYSTTLRLRRAAFRFALAPALATIGGCEPG